MAAMDGRFSVAIDDIKKGYSATVAPLVVKNPNFYRIDTNLLTPRVDATTWTLGVDGMVDHPFTISYAELLAKARPARPAER